MRFEILRSGRPIYISDDSLKERYEMETIHLYRDTEPMRRRQWKALKERMEAMCSKERYFNKPKR